MENGTAKKMVVTVEPWGGHGGTGWDDGTNTGVREITLTYGRCIDSIQVVYDKNSNPFKAEKHGGTGGYSRAEIKLQYPEDYLTSVSGHYGPVVHGGTPVIRSLTFKSNRKTFGPYGVQEGIPFAFSVEGGMIVGFKGRSDWYLDCLGFRLSPSPTQVQVQLTTKLQPKPQKSFFRFGSIITRNTATKDEEKSTVYG